MNTPKTYFQQQDLSEELPAPGYYPGRITSARFRKSAQGNRMLQVVYRLNDISTSHQHLTDYFVVEGASPQGVSLGRRRLVQLYRACGFQPNQGDEIAPAELVGAHLRVRVEHDDWEGQPRLRVVGYRSTWSEEATQHSPP
jgi:hypothetical protein